MSSLILASSSPQRRQLLEGLGVTFEVVPSAVAEDDYPIHEPLQRSQDLARMKAQDVAKNHAGKIIIGCDTLVVASDGTLLEKPASAKEALSMLQRQSGATSVVHSALCIIDATGALHEGVSSSSVTFEELQEEQMQWWISTKLWQGRSGGFQIDGPGQLMIQRIEGDWTGIVGLPVFLLGCLLEKSGFNLHR